MSIIIKCDVCRNEVSEDKNFRFEGRISEVKQVLVSANPRAQLVEKIIHLCHKCYRAKINL